LRRLEVSKIIWPTSQIGRIKIKKPNQLNQRQKTRLNVHHLAGIGAGLKASDLLTFPLCETHHSLLHSGIAEFEKQFKPQFEFIGMINERILRDNFLSPKDLWHCELVSDWFAAEIKEREKRLKLAIDI
jgi:hypothetical protein